MQKAPVLCTYANHLKQIGLPFVKATTQSGALALEERENALFTIQSLQLIRCRLGCVNSLLYIKTIIFHHVELL